jgi:hypothetical protein
MPNPSAITALGQVGYALLSPTQLAHEVNVNLGALEQLRASWSALPKDDYLRDGGRYRSRRHSCYVQDLQSGLIETPHRAHWQSTDYNALHGGIERWFEPIDPQVRAQPEWMKLLTGFGSLFARVHATPQWFIEAHQFRIDTAEGIGRPTPEGAHRDGVDYVVVILIDRRNVRGGETRVFQTRGSAGVRFTMTEPWTALLLDDAEVIHETTPIQPETDAPGIRDTLVITYRAEGFQEPAK